MLLKLLETSNAISNAFGKKKILVIPYLIGAIFDRLVNVSYSKTNGTSTLDMYRKEQFDFQNELWSLSSDIMFSELHQLLKS